MADPFNPRGRLIRFLAGASTVALLVVACSSSGASTAPSGAPASAPPAVSAAPGSAAPGGSAAAGGETTLGSNESDAVPKQAVANIVDYCQQQAGITVKTNTTEHNAFQNAISSYLQGTPDDVVKWFAGNRLRFFASQGLVAPVDDVWADIDANMTDALRAASKGTD